MLIGGSGPKMSLALAQAEAQREMMKTAGEDKKSAKSARNADFLKHANLRQEAIDTNREKADKGFFGTLVENIGLVVGIVAAALIVAFAPIASVALLCFVAGLALAGGKVLGDVTSAATFKQDVEELA